VLAVEASSDLVDWSEVGAFLHTGEDQDVSDAAAADAPARYYRLRPVGP